MAPKRHVSDDVMAVSTGVGLQLVKSNRLPFSFFQPRIISHFPGGCNGGRKKRGRSFRSEGTSRILPWSVMEGA